MAMQKIVSHANFVKFMNKHKMNIPGHSVTVNAVDKFLGNTLPPNPTCSDCRAQELARLTYVGKFRDDGLLHGRYTGKNGSVIRTYSVTYNHDWVMSYKSKAYNAITRGKNLNDSTPLAHMHNKKVNSIHFNAALKNLSQVL